MINKPTVVELLGKAENRFRLVIATAKRARQISLGSESMTAHKDPNPVTEAAQEIDEGKITVHLKTTPQKILSLEGKINGIEINQEDDIKQLEVEGVFVFIGLNPNTEFLQGSGIELDEQGLIKTNSRLETNIPGIFASGDVRSGSTMQIASAVGEGASAALSIREYLESQKH